MVTEFDVRRELTRINNSEESPFRKARQLLRLARRVRAGAWKLLHLSEALVQDCMQDQGIRMRDAAQRLGKLHDEIRLGAAELLISKPPMTFGYEPRFHAYPDWQGGTVAS